MKTFPNTDVSSDGLSGLTGYVYDGTTGEPLAGVTIETDPETVSATSTADGYFVLNLDGYEDTILDLIAAKSGFPTTRVDDVNFVAGNMMDVAISLYSTRGVVSGTVYNTKNQPLSEVTITATSNTDTTTAKTDDQGSFILENLSESKTYSVSFAHKETKYCTNEKTGLSLSKHNLQMGITLSGKPLSASTYEGSASCLSCHSEKSTEHNLSTHANVIKTPEQINALAYESFQNNHSITLDNYNFTLAQDSEDNLLVTLQGNHTYTVSKVYGGHLWKESYLTAIGNETFVLPIAWSLKEMDFILDLNEVPHWFDENNQAITPASSASYEQNCQSCHITGNAGNIVEDKVGCERCHGPGSTHIDKAQSGQADSSLYIVQPRHLSLKNNLQVCGQCHTKAKSYSSDFRPGDDLDDFITQNENNWAGTNYSKEFHQEYEDYKNSSHATNDRYQLRCSDCHDGHASLKQPAKDNSLCLGCHKLTDFPSTYSIQVHTQHSYSPESTGASRCTGCHMTKTGTVVTSGDVGGHSFESIHPEKSLNFLKEGKDPIPNACASCHNEHTSQNVLAGDLDSEEYLNLLIESYKAKYEQAKPSGDIASYTHSDNFVTTHGDYYLKSKSSCLNSCHGDNLSGGTLENGTNVPSCWSCHYSYPHDKRLELDGIGDQPWQSSHAPYYADNDCKTCHGEDYTTVINDLSCASCHASPGDDFSQFTDATCANQLCHGTPPLTGTHASHYAGMYPENLEEPFYGDDNNYSTNTEYRFGCGTCHPINPSKHRNKVVDIELFNETANPHSLKALMENTAHYDAETKTCSNTYCHSQTEYVGAGGSAIKVPFPVSFTDPSGELKDLDELVAAFNGDNFKTISSYFLWNHFSAPENQKEAYYWSLPSLWSLDELCNAGSLQTLCQGGVDMNGVDVFAYDPQNFGYKISYPINYEINQVRRYHTTPAWNSGESLSCNSCHSYPPRSQLTDDEWDPSDPNWESSQPTILSEAAIDKHSFIFSKLTADGETIEVGHLANMKPYSKAPLRCQVCHIETVERLNLASWENGTGWHVGDKGIIELDPISIADKAYHVNGTVDVNFDQSLAVTSYEFNDEFFPYTLRAFPEPTTSSGMTINTAMNYLGKPAYYGVHSGETPGAQWHPETKTCSNVSCHLEQSFVQWTAPYRPHSEAECSRCHQFHSDPTTINPDNATMCWPHAPHNGCEHKIPLKKEFNNF